MTAAPLKRWAYFGCGPRDSGHYLFGEGGQTVNDGYDKLLPRFRNWDGVFPPQPEATADLYRATVSRIPGCGMSVLAWWDRSQDKRHGSNSAVYAPHPECGPDWLIEEATRRFPWVFARLPQELTLWRAP